MKDIIIADHVIGSEKPPFVIAEMSANHNQSLENAIRIVEEVAKTGADAIKLQTYTPDTMTLKGALKIQDENSLWNGRELYDLYKEGSTPWEWHEKIFKRGRELGLVVFSTPFDHTSVDFLEGLNTEVYKIASFENTDVPLLRKVASTGKPVIMSTGTADLGDLHQAVAELRTHGCKDLVLLKCTSTYPADPSECHIRTIPHMRSLFGCHVGLSDHTKGIGVPVASVALGAVVVEKHVTLSRADGGIDSAFSLEPAELKSLVDECQRAYASLGRVNYDITSGEEKSMIFKRSIFLVNDLKKGEMINEKDIRVLRPGIGLSPRFYDLVVGKALKQDVKAGTPLSLEMI
ncbi:MAG: pseudaminic acid synthase [Flavobacteriales bacterium]|nr:pseudaminic acid synthase [Flavobacteriales bacterium]